MHSSSGCLAIEKSQATLSGLETLRDHQELSFSALNHTLARGVETRVDGLQVSDLNGIERRLEVLYQSLHQTVPHDSPTTALTIRGAWLPYLSNPLLSNDNNHLMHREGSKSFQKTRGNLPFDMIMRLVQPAVLTFERKGKLRQVLVPLDLMESTVLCREEKIILLRTILNLRLLLWLMQHSHVYPSKFDNCKGRSLLFREAQVAAIWDFWFSCSGIEGGHAFPAQHLIMIFSDLGSKGPSMSSIIERLHEGFRWRFLYAMCSATKLYICRMRQVIDASNFLATRLRELQRECDIFAREVSDVYSLSAARIETEFTDMVPQQRLLTSRRKQDDSMMNSNQARLMMLTSRTSDIECTVRYIEGRVNLLHSFEDELLTTGSWFQTCMT